MAKYKIDWLKISQEQKRAWKKFKAFFPDYIIYGRDDEQTLFHAHENTPFYPRDVVDFFDEVGVFIRVFPYPERYNNWRFVGKITAPYIPGRPLQFQVKGDTRVEVEEITFKKAFEIYEKILRLNEIEAESNEYR